MLFTLGLLLLLTPFPSFQTTTNEKRDAKGSDETSAHAVFSLSKPKTTAAPSKQIVHPTLKINTVNHTILPTTTSHQKPPRINATAAIKGRQNPVVIQTALSAAVKASTASRTITNKDKLTVSVNQTASAKSASVRESKSGKLKHFPTGAPNVQSTRSLVSAGTKTPKGNPQHSANHTASVKSPSTSNEKTVKDKHPPTVSQNVQSTSIKPSSASGSKTTKIKPTSSVNQTNANSPSTSDVKSKDKPASKKLILLLTPAKASNTNGSVVEKNKATSSADPIAPVKAPSSINREKPPPSQPLKVIISDGCNSTHAKEQELKLKPGAPLVMTHKISLLPGGCTGGCEAEMAALKGRVARLEREMSSLKEKCPCSANCQNHCSGNGECEKGKCICQQGFMGSDCSQCAQGADCNKKGSERKTQTAQEKMSKDKENQKKGPYANETDTNVKASDPKQRAPKQSEKQDIAEEKIHVKINSSGAKLNSSVSQSPNDDGTGKEALKGKITIKKVPQKSETKVDDGGSKQNHLRDEPQSNVTHVGVRKMNDTTGSVTNPSKTTRINKTQTGKESLQQSTLGEKNVTQSSGHKQGKISKSDGKNVQASDKRKKTQNVVNATIMTPVDGAKLPHNKTSSHGSRISLSKTGGLGSVRAENISSYSFTIMWSAPQGMFKNFTVIRREPQTEGDGDEQEPFEEDVTAKEKVSAVRNVTEVPSVSTDMTSSSDKAVGSRGKAEAKRISMVVPGNVRSVEFSKLRANTRYVLHVYGTAADRRSKIHRVTVTTGPEPPTEMVFSNVTESSLSVSWTKPKAKFTGFRVTYINIVTGETLFTTVDSRQSHVVLSELSPGSSYIISVASRHGRVQSDELISAITTVPAPPTRLQVVNVTDTKAVLQWTPSLGKVDRFIITYESSKIPNVTVTVMLPGNSVEHQLRGLQRGTLHTVKVLSQKDSLQSTSISTKFTTANVVKASEVGARSAVIAWRTPVVYHSYRVIYYLAGEETKEMILEPSVTQYKLTGLLPMSRYTVVVQGEKNGHYTSVVTSEFITGKLRFPYPTECSQELLNGALRSGEVDIYPQGKDGGAVRVYCDMEADGGGWTVFQRRMNGKTDFYRTWNEYRAGFGNLSEEFWLGNELLHNLTSIGQVSLRVDMRSENETAYAHYTNFSIASEDSHYAIKLSGYTGTAGDSMRYHNGRPFSARDKNPDPLGIHCARAYMGGWWYKNCYKTNLNGLYGINSNNQGVVWIDWQGKDFSIPFTEMKFRPSRFSPITHG
ncbi:uncharacterized protein tnxba isoform 1-T2 [Menidia menidia]